MAHQTRLQSSEDTDSGATRHSQISAQCNPYLTSTPQHYPAAMSESQSASKSTMNSLYFSNKAPTEGGFSATDYPHYFDIEDSQPIPIEHHPSSELHRYAKNDYPYDPRLFDVGAQFLPTASTAPATTEAPRGVEMMAFQHAYVWQQPAPSVQEQVESPPSMMHPSVHLPLMPTAPDMSTFEPMITTWEMQRAHPSATYTATPSPSLSSTAAQSPASSAMPTFSRKNSHNYFGQESPESVHMLPNTKVDLGFEPVPISGPSTRKKSPTNANERARDEPSNKKRKPVSRTITTNLPVENNNTPSRKSNYRPTRNASNVSVRRVPPGQTTPFSNSISSTDAATEDGSPHTTANSLESQARGSEKPAPHGAPSLVAGNAVQPPYPGSQRERNRTAATKCRAKTKAGVMQLEAMERTMSAQNAELSAQVTDLREQVLAIKHELLRHGNCDCQIIQRYLTSEAMRIGGGDRPDH